MSLAATAGPEDPRSKPNNGGVGGSGQARVRGEELVHFMQTTWCTCLASELHVPAIVVLTVWSPTEASRNSTALHHT